MGHVEKVDKLDKKDKKEEKKPAAEPAKHKVETHNMDNFLKNLDKEAEEKKKEEKREEDLAKLTTPFHPKVVKEAAKVEAKPAEAPKPKKPTHNFDSFMKSIEAENTPDAGVVDVKKEVKKAKPA